MSSQPPVSHYECLRGGIGVGGTPSFSSVATPQVSWKALILHISPFSLLPYNSVICLGFFSLSLVVRMTKSPSQMVHVGGT